MRIRMNYYSDPGSGNSPYESGSRIQGKNFSQNSIFLNFVEKMVLTYRFAALYKFGQGHKRTAEVTEALQVS